MTYNKQLNKKLNLSLHVDSVNSNDLLRCKIYRVKSNIKKNKNKTQKIYIKRTTEI